VPRVPKTYISVKVRCLQMMWQTRSHADHLGCLQWRCLGTSTMQIYSWHVSHIALSAWHVCHILSHFLVDGCSQLLTLAASFLLLLSMFVCRGDT
jgi:hypothetical protein